MEIFRHIQCFILLALSVYQLHGFNISVLIEEYDAVCGGYSECTSITSFNKNQDFLLKYGHMCPPCSCNKNCIIEGNCCPDVFYSIQPSCVQTNFLSENPNRDDNKSVFMIDQCPTGDTNETDIHCKHSYELEAHLTNIPVTSLQSGLTYRNKQCAKCHGESEINIIPWNLQIECHMFADFNFLSSYKEIIILATKRKCNMFYSPSEFTKTRECGKVTESELDLINRCNVSGTWTNYDPDIDYSCETYDNKYHFFKNLYCYLCNPPLRTVPSISHCNTTGYWNVYDPELEAACLNTRFSTVTLPFKNVNCYLCNRNNTDTTESSKFVDATLQIQESVSEEKYFKFVYYIEHVDIKSIIEKKIRENVYANNLRNEKYNTPLIRKHSNLLKTSKRALNMTNLYQKYFAYTGTSDFCPNNSLFSDSGNCDCEEDCYFTNRKCCVDKLFDVSTTCTDERMSKYGDSFLVYDSCKYNKNSQISKFCEDDTIEDMYSILPVEKNSNFLTFHFKNIYCALCNEKLQENISDAKNVNFNVDNIYFWEILITCDAYISPFYHVSFDEYFEFTRENNCQFTFGPRTRGKTCAKNLHKSCNETENWINNDMDIQYACKNLNMPSSWYMEGNPFCSICNPPNRDEILYTKCNMTGLWDQFDKAKEENCRKIDHISSYAPYKNIFCKSCNEHTYNTLSHIVPMVGVDYDQHGTSGRYYTVPTIYRSFRTLFSISSYTSETPQEEHLEAKCNGSQVYDTLKVKSCRCYMLGIVVYFTSQGRHLKNLKLTLDNNQGTSMN